MKKMLLLLLLISSCYEEGKLTMDRHGEPVYFYCDYNNKFLDVHKGDFLYGTPVKNVDSVWRIVYSCGVFMKIRKDSVWNKKWVDTNYMPKQLY